jgi:hypothetical protein
MVNRTSVLVIFLALTLIMVVQTPTVRAQEGVPGVPGAALFEVDSFTYRASFRLADGTEAFLIRSSYRATYLYQHHQPSVNQHYMSASVGFYFGKTMIGRSIVQSVTFDEIAFYPFWTDSAGIDHDLLFDEALFSVHDNVTDGMLVGGMLLIDDEAISQYLPMIGGTYVFTGLEVLLDDGATMTVGDGSFQIQVQKYSNEYIPRAAVLEDSDNVSYESDSRYITLTSAASTPLIVFLDLVIGSTLLGTGTVLLALVVLHMKGKIVLPLDRVRTHLVHRLEASVNRGHPN